MDVVWWRFFCLGWCHQPSFAAQSLLWKMNDRDKLPLEGIWTPVMIEWNSCVGVTNITVVVNALGCASAPVLASVSLILYVPRASLCTIIGMCCMKFCARLRITKAWKEMKAPFLGALAYASSFSQKSVTMYCCSGCTCSRVCKRVQYLTARAGSLLCKFFYLSTSLCVTCCSLYLTACCMFGVVGMSLCCRLPKLAFLSHI